MSDAALPTDPADLSLDLLNGLVREQMPDVAFSDYRVSESHTVGLGHASSAGRICIEVNYAGCARSDLPRHLVLKVAQCAADDPTRPAPMAGAGGALYRNEVNVYRHLNPASFLESPVYFGGAYDSGGNSMLLMLEDLSDRGVTFPHVNVPTSVKRMQSLLDQLAILHARYWNSPRLAEASGWLESHVKGHIHDQFLALRPHVTRQLAAEQFKREMVERTGTDADSLFRQVQRLQQHQATLPQTLCHGDTHIGNTYRLPDDTGGLFDWQLASQGFCLHDISYLLATGLSVAERRAHERDLLAYYRERLLAHGVADVPGLDDLWLEYCRGMVWGLYIGWLITPVINYGWEITVMAHLRTMTAYEDLDASRLIDSLG